MSRSLRSLMGAARFDEHRRAGEGLFYITHRARDMTRDELLAVIGYCLVERDFWRGEAMRKIKA